MKTSIVNIMSKVAKSNFKLKDYFFEGFDSLEIEEKSILSDEEQDFSADLDIWAKISLNYEGEPPESYRVLNRIIQDWVDENEKALEKIIKPELKKFLREKYPNIDLSELDEEFEEFIWEDQVDYYPEVDEDNKKINCLIELVLEIEDIEDVEDIEDIE
jgi:hypothetical protein